MRVLMIEDDTILGKAVRDHIAVNHSVDWVTRLDEATEHVNSAVYDLILLDLMLPDGLGINFYATFAPKAVSRLSLSSRHWTRLPTGSKVSMPGQTIT